MLRYVAAIGEFNAMIYIPPIRAGKVSAMRKICELWFRGTRGKNIDHSRFILFHANASNYVERK